MPVPSPLALRSAIVAEARSWIGTPFRWQASAKGIGCDCRGLVAGVARELGLPAAASVEATIACYREAVDERALKAGLARLFDRSGGPDCPHGAPGDVLLLRFGGKAQHLGICSGAGLIHCYGRGPDQVVEVPLAVALRAFPLDSAWSWRP